MSIKVGIFFGGPSREREISFAGGRTVYDNLDKGLFTPVPIFVDSFQRWYLLDWQYLYRGSIRDFFPPIGLAVESAYGFQSYQESLGPQDELSLEAMGQHIGRRIRREELSTLIDLAFLALHGEYGEDGQLQRELEYAGVPYTGSGVRASEIGMDKALQKELMSAAGFPSPPILVIDREDFSNGSVESFFDRSVQEIGWPMVIRPARQGSSIGVAILKESDGLAGFERAVNAAFFREPLLLTDYHGLDAYDRLEYVRHLSDLRDGIAFPMDAQRDDHRLTLYTPDELFNYLESATEDGGHPLVLLEGHQSEQRVIVEGFIDGKEFSTIVLRTPEGQTVALPPTEIVKGDNDLFDYRSKYLPGRSRKVTPIDLPAAAIQAIRQETERLFNELGFGVYARIDGFYTPDGTVYLNDPNTTSGMMPSSFFFHQAAEIGLNPSQLLTYIIRTSLEEQDSGGAAGQELDHAMAAQRADDRQQERIAVLLGGNSFERHISVESGRNIYEKLSSSVNYRPLPFFLTEPLDLTDTGQPFVLYQLPVNLLLKDNADDIRDKLNTSREHPVIEEIRTACGSITRRYADPDVVFEPVKVPLDRLPEIADAVFIALHGRPGEDGQVQRELDRLGLPYNGSDPESAAVTIDKFATLQTLQEAGLPVTEQWLATRDEFYEDEAAFYDKVERTFGYPLIAKPVDDGCSSAVKLLKQRDELHAYCHLTFRPATLEEANARRELKLTAQEEWPAGKETILFEQVIGAKGAEKFLEITGGILTHRGVDGEVRYEVFEPSETLAGGEVLSLEEKFLAGEGQNLTPARLATEDYSYDYVAGQVKADLERAARALGVGGYCRIDAFVRVYADGRVETIIIEVNSLPGMTPATAIFHQAALAGYQPHQLIDAILQYAKAKAAVPATPAYAYVGAGATNTPMADQVNGLNTPPPLTPTPPSPAPVASWETKDQPASPPKKKTKKGFFPRLIGLLTSAAFLKNLAAAGLLLVGMFIFLRSCLNWYTNHGDSMQLPTFEALPIDEARQIADDKGLKLVVTEGAFDPDRPAGGIVVQQQPSVGSRVKRNRTVYLTILSDNAPEIQLPGLIGNYDYDSYTQQLAELDINFKIREEVFDAKQERNTIVHFFYDEQKITDADLRSGIRVPQGSTLEFVVTKREGGNVPLPDYTCKQWGQAEFEISGSRFVVGNVYGNVANRSSAYIERTNPAPGTSLPTGSKIDVYLTEGRPSQCN